MTAVPERQAAVADLFGVDVSAAMKASRLEAARHKHAAYIIRQLAEMRRCLALSEAARDKYYKAVDFWKGKGFDGTMLDIELRNDYKAQKNVSDNQLYDRWAAKYAAVVSAEIAAFEHDLHPKE